MSRIISNKKSDNKTDTERSGWKEVQNAHNKRKSLGYSSIIKIQGAETALRNSGIKATKPRQEILNVFGENPQPMSVEGVSMHLKGKNINLSTVYRTVELLEKHRIIRKLNINGEMSFYEIRNDHHHHIICMDCGIIEELNDCVIEKVVPFSSKFASIFDHSLEFFGRCKKCINN